MAAQDVFAAHGTVADPQRMDFLDQHLMAVRSAIAAGVPVAGVDRGFARYPLDVRHSSGTATSKAQRLDTNPAGSERTIGPGPIPEI